VNLGCHFCPRSVDEMNLVLTMRLALYSAHNLVAEDGAACTAAVCRSGEGRWRSEPNTAGERSSSDERLADPRRRDRAACDHKVT